MERSLEARLRELERMIYAIREVDDLRTQAVILIQAAIALERADPPLAVDLAWVIRRTAAGKLRDPDWNVVYWKADEIWREGARHAAGQEAEAQVLG
jgi:hypothetical protein